MKHINEITTYRVIDLIKDNLSKKEIDVLIVAWNETVKIEKIMTYNKRFVVFIAGNEHHKSFDFLYKNKNCLAVIKNYPHIKNYTPLKSIEMYEEFEGKLFIKTEKEDTRTINIPLGTCKDHTFKDFYEIKKTKYISFYGQTSGIRSHQIQALKNIKGFECNLYEGFGLKRDSKEYIKNLCETKISFCPSGHSPETYRLFESGLANCFIIHNPLPFTKYYREMPGFSLGINNNFLLNFQNYLDQIEKIENPGTFDWAKKWTDPEFLNKEIIEHLENNCEI